MQIRLRSQQEQQKQEGELYSVLRENHCETRIVNPAKLSFKKKKVK